MMKTKTQKTFWCEYCTKVKSEESDFVTGYALDEYGGKICYECCAIEDRYKMEEKGKIVLYLTRDDNKNPQVTNWPGTLVFPVLLMKEGKHNIVGKRIDVWFRVPPPPLSEYIGEKESIWWGVQYGDNTEVVHCKRTKLKYWDIVEK